MSNEDLHLTYRPASLDEVIGQDAIVKSIRGLIEDEGLPHSFLFHGPSGVGKTTMARIIAKEVGCSKNNIMEFDAASHSGVDAVRELTSGLRYAGIGNSPNKIYIIDECHSLSKQAWQVLLKPIEEPMGHVYFVLCTTELSKVPKTIQTRCHSYGFKDASYDNLIDLLESINDEEDFGIEDDLVQYIAKQSEGSYRQAIVNLSACRNATDKKEAAGILSTVADNKEVIDLCRLLIGGRSSFVEAVKIASSISKDGGVQPESVRIIVLNYMAAVLMKNPNKDAEGVLSIMDSFSTPYDKSEKMAPLLLSLGDVFFN